MGARHERLNQTTSDVITSGNLSVVLPRRVEQPDSSPSPVAPAVLLARGRGRGRGVHARGGLACGGWLRGVRGVHRARVGRARRGGHTDARQAAVRCSSSQSRTMPRLALLAVGAAGHVVQTRA